MATGVFTGVFAFTAAYTVYGIAALMMVRLTSLAVDGANAPV